jgi:hypothetical protein
MCTCTCEPELNSMNQACPSCQAEYAEWSATLEEVGIIGPWEQHTIQRGGPRSRELRKRQARARANHRLQLEAAANAAYYAALGEIA